MKESEVWQLLEAGGLSQTVADLLPWELESSDWYLPKYNGLLDPRGAEALGQLLVEKVRPFEADALLLWEDPEDVVLGYIVGRDLGVRIIRSFDEEGLIGHVGRFPPSPRVALVSDAFRNGPVLRAMCALVEQQGGEVVGAASIVQIPQIAAAVKGILRMEPLVKLTPKEEERAADGRSVP